ncbi:MAG: hypothetical protein RID42_14590 [Alphaproteobacteria bacterium]
MRGLLVTVVLLGAFVAGTAWADAIDGEWCSVQGRTLAIEGPRIHTPGGNRIEGLYDRHGFIYTVPPGEPDAGKEVRMVMVNEDTVQMAVGAATAFQTWRRCRPGTS